MDSGQNNRKFDFHYFSKATLPPHPTENGRLVFWKNEFNLAQHTRFYTSFQSVLLSDSMMAMFRFRRQIAPSTPYRTKTNRPSRGDYFDFGALIIWKGTNHLTICLKQPTFHKMHYHPLSKFKAYRDKPQTCVHPFFSNSCALLVFLNNPARRKKKNVHLAQLGHVGGSSHLYLLAAKPLLPSGRRKWSSGT